MNSNEEQTALYSELPSAPRAHGGQSGRLVRFTAAVAIAVAAIGASTAAMAQVHIGVNVGGPGYIEPVYAPGPPPPPGYRRPPPPPPRWHRHWHRRNWHRPPPHPHPGWR